ncbi:hypothetical protein QJS10_CPA16g01669 [Acorus calamus]|uniref:DUF7787 domain-containing protein n=1 Tax=Acorus calamus TaxID=4465 RepID=A0AAV9D070_ACOCL|nr:hypothetical protein QJS10_CPA16g01669 [Acorus calamus]
MKKLTLDDYAEFLADPTHCTLTCLQLNEILYVNGFRKLHHQSKRDPIMETMKSIDMMDVLRSTVEESGPSPFPAYLSVEEVLRDLTVLHWIDNDDEEEVKRVHQIYGGDEALLDLGFMVRLPIGARKRRSKRKRISIGVVISTAPR